MATISLTWKDLNLGEEGFSIYRSETPMDVNNMPAPIATLAENIGSYDDKDVTPGNQYYYRVSVTRNGVEKISGEILRIAAPGWVGLELTGFSFRADHGSSFGGGYGLFFSPNGNNMYVSGRPLNGNNITQWSLSVPYDLTSATSVAGINFDDYGFSSSDYPSVSFSRDGRFMYAPTYSPTNRRIIQFDLDIPWDLTSVRRAQSTAHLSGSGGNSGGIDISRDGTTIILSPRSSNIFQVKLNVPYDVTTVARVDVIPVGSRDWVAAIFDGTGSKLYLKDRNSERFTWVDLSTPYDVSSHSSLRTHNIGGSTSNFALAFTHEGRGMWTGGGSSASGRIIEYRLN